MGLIPSFHEVRFPIDIALGSAGGPERRTEIVTLGSGHEQRNARWKNSRRKYNAGYGVKTLDDLSLVIDFFEERRGRLFGFRFRDPLDHKSSLPGSNIYPTDQKIAVGDGQKSKFQLIKSYGSSEFGWQRNILKPVGGSVRMVVEGIEKFEGSDFLLDEKTGEIEFLPNAVPGVDDEIYAGFEFDVPVRFDADEITVNMKNFIAGDISSIPLIEILQ